MQELRRSLPFEDFRRERIIRQTRDLVQASIAAGLLIAALQGLTGGLLFAFLGIGAPVFWGVMYCLFAGPTSARDAKLVVPRPCSRRGSPGVEGSIGMMRVSCTIS